MNMKHKSGFTLLEIIIVIIIIGVLASLALPRLFSTVEYSRATEAFSAIQALRGSLERCYLGRGGNYTGCDIGVIDVENPAFSNNSHFTYTITGQNVTGYVVTAFRNTRDGGGGTANSILLTQAAAGITRTGTTAFQGVQ